MLKDRDSSAIVAVSDIERARRFYSDTLGLKLADEGMDDVLGYRTGKTWLTVYRSDYAGTNRANAVTWSLGDEFDAIVADLKSRGVVFERYDDMDRDGDVHLAGEMRLAWLKDPDGNILHLMNV